MRRGNGIVSNSRLGTVNRICWRFIAVALVLFALLVSLIRGLLPQLTEVRNEIVTYLYEQYQLEVQLGEISAKWQAYGPALSVHNLVLPQQDNLPMTIVAKDVHFKLDFWDSLMTASPQIETVNFDGLQVALNLDELKQLSSNSKTSSDLDWLYALLLEQLDHFSLTDASLQLYSSQHQFRPIFIDNLQWLNSPNSHRGQGVIHVDENASENELLSISVDLTGNGYQPDTVAGELYVAASSLDLGEWASRREDPLLDLKHIEFEGVINLEAWVGFGERKIQDALLTFKPSWLKWGTETEPHRLDIQSGSITWQPQENGWRLDSHQLNFVTNDEPWQPLHLAVNYQQGELFANINEISVEHFTPLLPLIPGIWQQEVETWHYVNPQGTIGPIQLYKPQNDGLRAAVKINDISWSAHQKIPGLKPIDLSLNWAANKLSFTLPEQNYAIDFSNNFRQALNFDGKLLRGHFDADNMRLNVPALELANPDISIQAGVVLDLAERTHMALAANVQITDVAMASKYFPLQAMDDSLVEYLESGLIAGQIPDATVVWNGYFDQFPYDDKAGVFQAAFTLDDAIYKFQPDWPAVTELNLSALFENAGMHLKVNKGLLGEVPADGAIVDIERFNLTSVLTVDADLSADAQAATAVIQQSPLADSVGETLAVIQIHDNIRTQLDLMIPLYAGASPVSKGVVTFEDNPVYIAQPGMQLERVTGQISFVDEAVQGQEVVAQLYNQPLQFSFSTEKQNRNMALNVDLQGRWDLQTLPDEFTNPLSEFYQGSLEWDGNVLMIFDPQGYTLQVQVASDLIGTEFNAPAPFAKDAQTPKVLEAQLVGDNVNTTLSVNLANQAEFWGEFTTESGDDLAHYDIMLGRRFKLGDQLLKRDGHINIDLPQAELTQWLPIITSFASQQAEVAVESEFTREDDGIDEPQALEIAAAKQVVNQLNQGTQEIAQQNLALDDNGQVSRDSIQLPQRADDSVQVKKPPVVSEARSLANTNSNPLGPKKPRSLFPPLKQIDASIDTLDVMGQNFDQLTLVARPQDQIWRFDIQAEQFVGSIDFFPQWREQGLKIVAQKLHLNPEMRDSANAEFTAKEMLESVPTLAVDVDDFRLFDIPLGILCCKAILMSRVIVSKH
ncbi:TIGR02099 family protein [Shewanella maritima]|uniref:TIGR02099 family protein n=1 Tax=Shewanella maritima TaxID=2520507 RepID=A0A411PHB2_9GAMM|nr:TIGR02099 family protein [Shewanella maritima]